PPWGGRVREPQPRAPAVRSALHHDRRRARVLSVDPRGAAARRGAQPRRPWLPDRGALARRTARGAHVPEPRQARRGADRRDLRRLGRRCDGAPHRPAAARHLRLSPHDRDARAAAPLAAQLFPILLPLTTTSEVPRTVTLRPLIVMSPFFLITMLPLPQRRVSSSLASTVSVLLLRTTKSFPAYAIAAPWAEMRRSLSVSSTRLPPDFTESWPPQSIAPMSPTFKV